MKKKSQAGSNERFLSFTVQKKGQTTSRAIKLRLEMPITLKNMSGWPRCAEEYGPTSRSQRTKWSDISSSAFILLFGSGVSMVSSPFASVILHVPFLQLLRGQVLFFFFYANDPAYRFCSDPSIWFIIYVPCLSWNCGQASFYINDGTYPTRKMRDALHIQTPKWKKKKIKRTLKHFPHIHLIGFRRGCIGISGVVLWAEL